MITSYELCPTNCKLCTHQAGSDLSLNSEFDGKEKKGIKDKVKGMFKRSTRSPRYAVFSYIQFLTFAQHNFVYDEL